MPMDKITHEMRLSRWTAIMNECTESGMPKTVWCKENGVDVKQFFYWQRRIREEVYKEMQTKTSTAATFAELPVLSAPNLQEVSDDTGAVIRINNITVEINNRCSAELLKTLLMVSAHVQ